jgi:pentose-5-phosphate-3-epimerase
MVLAGVVGSGRWQVAELRAKYPTVDIEVDGGLGPSTIDEASKVGLSHVSTRLIMCGRLART